MPYEDFMLLEQLTFIEKPQPKENICECNTDIAYENTEYICTGCGFIYKYNPKRVHFNSNKTANVYNSVLRFEKLLNSFFPKKMETNLNPEILEIILPLRYKDIKTFIKYVSKLYPKLSHRYYEMFYIVNQISIPKLDGKWYYVLLNEYASFGSYTRGFMNKKSSPNLHYTLRKLLEYHDINAPYNFLIYPKATVEQYNKSFESWLVEFKITRTI